MRTVLEMYVTLLPVILAGVANMVLVKAPIWKRLNVPMDARAKWRDGRRLLGDNKTWKGFWGMVLLGAGATMAWGAFCMAFGLEELNLLYRNYPNTELYNALIGALLGLAYVVFELPNSFLKRRLGIKPGNTPKGLRGVPFAVLDQVDSLFGCVLVVALVWPMSLAYYLAYVALGGITHIVLNVLLYAAKLKKNV